LVVDLNKHFVKLLTAMTGARMLDLALKAFKLVSVYPPHVLNPPIELVRALICALCQGGMNSNFMEPAMEVLRYARWRGMYPVNPEHDPGVGNCLFVYTCMYEEEYYVSLRDCLTNMHQYVQRCNKNGQNVTWRDFKMVVVMRKRPQMGSHTPGYQLRTAVFNAPDEFEAAKERLKRVLAEYFIPPLTLKEIVGRKHFICPNSVSALLARLYGPPRRQVTYHESQQGLPPSRKYDSK
jgi:hypothetical protein